MVPGSSTAFRLGVDIGGTFTDIVLIDDNGRVATRKVSSSPDDYGRAIVVGVGELLADVGVVPTGARDLVHGTTVATNAILERRGPPTGLLTTVGFRDTLEIGRLRYPRLYDLAWRKPVPLVPRRWRQEVPGRLSARGDEVEPVDDAAARQAIAFLAREGVSSVAIALLHSYADPSHERRLGAIAAEMAPHIALSLSCDVLPEIGEYERTSTTVINAYLKPIVGDYLASLAGSLRRLELDVPVLVMQSNGGIMSARAAADQPIHIVESGPAAGVIAARALAQRLDLPEVIALDMGGTTAKASVVEHGQVQRAAEYEVGAGVSVGNRLNRGAGYILRVPAIDIAEVGAGGGSLAWLDDAGGLHVGPRSAGAVPGPVCYGAGGGEPTLTDANLLLGYLNPTGLLDGALPLDRARAAAVLAERIAAPLGIDVLRAADGIHQIGIASMVRVVKAVSSERGRDPRRFSLVAFGGNGPLHAAGVARELGIGRVVVPPWPGLFSAFGLLLARPARHFSRTVLRPIRELTPEHIDVRFGELERLAYTAMAEDGHPAERVQLDRSADLRYVGQSFDLRVTAEPSPDPIARLEAAFGTEHQRTYGHRADSDPVELVHLRVTATAIEPQTTWPEAVAAGRSRPPASRPAYFGARMGLVETPVLGRGDVPAEPVVGPMIVEEYDATTLVPPGWTVRRDAHENLILEGVAP